MQSIRITSIYLLPVSDFAKNFGYFGTIHEQALGIVHDIDIWLINAVPMNRQSMIDSLMLEKTIAEQKSQKSFFRTKFWHRQSEALQILVNAVHNANGHTTPGLDFIMELKEILPKYQENINYGIYLFDIAGRPGR